MEYIGGIIMLAAYMGGLMALLATGCIFADCVLPRCLWLIRLCERILDIDLGGKDH